MTNNPFFVVDDIPPPRQKISKAPILRFVIRFVNRVVLHSISAVTAAAAAAATTTTRPAQAVRPRLDLRLRQGRNLHQRRWFVLHAGVFQHVGVFAAGSGVTVFQMLSEMVGAEEFLRLVALAEFMYGGQVFETPVPIR